MKELIVNKAFHSPYFIFVEANEDDKEHILKELGLDGWLSLDSINSDDLYVSENRHFYTTWIDGWFQIMDDWNYTLWFNPELIQKIQQLSHRYQIFTCSVGEACDSFDFRLFHNGIIKRAYVVEDPSYNGGYVTKNEGTPLAGEQKALKMDDPKDRIIALANSLGINTEPQLDKINVYQRPERTDKQFVFNEDHY